MPNNCPSHKVVLRRMLGRGQAGCQAFFRPSALNSGLVMGAGFWTIQSAQVGRIESKARPRAWRFFTAGLHKHGLVNLKNCSREIRI